MMMNSRVPGKPPQIMYSSVKVNPTARRRVKKKAEECSCACWKEIAELKKIVSDLKEEILRHSELIAEFEELKQVVSADYEREPTGTCDEELQFGDGTHAQFTISEVSGSQIDGDEEYQDETEHDTEISGGPYFDQLPSSSSSCSSFGKINVSSLATVTFSTVDDSQSEMDDEKYDLEIEDDVKNEPVDSDVDPDVLNASLTDQNEQYLLTYDGRNRKRPIRSKVQNTPSPSDSLDSPLVCPHCTSGHVFKERGSLRKHILHFHSSLQKLYVCSQCNKTFPYREGLAYHERSVHEGIRYLCGEPGCDYAYSTITRLRKHKRMSGHHSPHQVISISDKGPNTTYKKRRKSETSQ